MLDISLKTAFRVTEVRRSLRGLLGEVSIPGAVSGSRLVKNLVSIGFICPINDDRRLLAVQSTIHCLVPLLHEVVESKFGK